MEWIMSTNPGLKKRLNNNIRLGFNMAKMIKQKPEITEIVDNYGMKLVNIK